jgi:hypothetical protein
MQEMENLDEGPKLPDKFHSKVEELEIAHYEGRLNHATMKQLFELYSVNINI